MDLWTADRDSVRSRRQEEYDAGFLHAQYNITVLNCKNVDFSNTEVLLSRAPPLCIFCMSLFVNTPDSDNQLVRSVLCA